MSDLSDLAHVTVEAAVLPDLPVIDTHIHLWERDDYFAADMVADAQSGHRVLSTIYVECGMGYSDDPRVEYRPVGEDRHVLDQIDLVAGSGHDLAAGILGAADLTLGADVRGVLEAHVAASAGRFRGVRCRVAWDPDPVAGYGEPGYPDVNVLREPSFAEGAAVLADMGLVLDLWAFHTQLEEIAVFAETLPNLTIVLDHVGGPLGVGPYAGRRDEVFSQWEAGIRRLARVPNVNVKLSGLAISRLGFGFQQNGQVSSSDELARLWGPYIRTCIDAFGARRSIFGSNYPVDRAAAPYAILLNAYKKMTMDRSDVEIEDIYMNNAKRIYGI